MEPDDTPPKATLQELLEKYDIEGAPSETPFKEWFHRAIEQEYGVSAESASIVMSDDADVTDDADASNGTCFVDIKEEKGKTVYKLGELVRRSSFVSEGEVGVVTRINKVKQLGKVSTKYMVTFQKTNMQLWFNADQLERLKES